MANIGEQLLQPESGYKRINDTNINIKYTNANYTIDSNINYNFYNNDRHTVNNNGTVEFYVYTSKIIILGGSHHQFGNNVGSIIIDDNIKGQINSYTDNTISNTNNQGCYPQYINNNLEKKVHHIKITYNTATNLDAIDIDEDGHMIYCDENNKLYYDVTPIMTSNNTPSPYVVTTSSNLPKYEPYKMFDSNFSTSWCPNVSSIGWVQLNFGKKTKINSFTISNRHGNQQEDLTKSPKNFEIYGSNNGNDYIKLKEFIVTDWKIGGETRFFKLDNVYNYNMYKINITSNNGFVDDLIIVDLRYLLAVDTPFYLIKSNETYYNYDELSDSLVEVSDSSILNANALENTCIYNLNKIIPHLDKLSDSFKLISNQNNKIKVQGLKSNKELVVGKESFSTRFAKNIDYFKLDNDAIDIKIAFSIDDGTTWKTWNATNSSFEDLSITIPIGKAYIDFNSTDLVNWNTAKDTIYTDGVDITTLNNLDFNSLDIDKIRFAYVLSATDTENMSKMKELIWQFDSNGVMELCDTSDVKVQLTSEGVKLISTIDANMLKVNITYEGVEGGTSTSLEIDRTISDIQDDIDNIFI